MPGFLRTSWQPPGATFSSLAVPPLTKAAVNRTHSKRCRDKLTANPREEFWTAASSAKTGKLIWGSPEITVHVHSQGMVGDIDPSHPGMEGYAGEAKGGTNYWLYSAKGERLSDQSLGELSPKAIFWLDGPTKVFIVGNTIFKWPREKIGEVEGRIVAIADCLGDWREEIITALDGEIRIYTTTVPATSRRVCLMQDRLYRTDVAMQTMGYFYPPQLGGTPLPLPER